MKLLGEALDRLERHVALAALDRTHVCPVDAQEFGELFLRKAERFTVASEIVTNRRLEVTDHVSTVIDCYLWIYRLMSSIPSVLFTSGALCAQR